MNIRTIDDLNDVLGKRVLIRCDFNVQIVDGKIMDAFRIEQSLPTIRRMIDAGAKVAIVSHFGRPKGERSAEFSLAPIARELESQLGRPVLFVGDCLNREFLADMKDGDVAVLENLRFHSGEESNDFEFAKSLAIGFECYVNDAFATSHRAHASIDAITKFLPSYGGLLLASEISALSALLENPKRPLVGIISSSKVKSKVGVIKAMAKLCDRVILGGGIGTGFHAALGATNIVQEEANIERIAGDDEIKNFIIETMKEYGDKIVLPVSKGCAPVWEPNASRVDKKIGDILPGDIVMDEGPESVEEYKRVIAGAKTVVWNGTVGMAEWIPTWSVGTFALARFIAEKTSAGELESVIGGGDTVAALEYTNTKDKMTYVSTGGGAFLEFLEGREWPGIKALGK